MNGTGSFSGNPKTEWLVDGSGADRNMALLEDFSYTDPDGRVWLAPQTSVVNGASIPPTLWGMVGSPYTGDYRRASIVHDVACGDPAVSRKDADVMFYYACLCGGCSWLHASMLYAGVRIGAWAAAALPLSSPVRTTVLYRVPLQLNAEEGDVQTTFQSIVGELRRLPAGASLRDLDGVIDRHLI